MAQKVIRKGNREWYAVVAPNVFKNKEVGEILGYTPKEIVGRCVELSYYNVTENPRDKIKFFNLKIVSANDRKVQTEPVGIKYSTSMIHRTLKRTGGTSELLVAKFDTADKKKVTMKMYLITNVKIVRSIKSNLKARAIEFLTEKLSKMNSEQLFEPNYLESLGKEIKSYTKTIYPINNIAFWKVLVA